MSEALNLPKFIKTPLAVAAASGVLVGGADMVVNTNMADGESISLGKQVPSSIWSGYVALAKNNQKFTAVEGTFTVEKIDCTPSKRNPVSALKLDAAAQWVGLDGYDDNTVEQTGVTGYCFDNNPPYSIAPKALHTDEKPRFTPRYYAWWMDFGGGDYSEKLKFSVRPGDVMKASVDYEGDDHFLMKLRDDRTKKTYKKLTTCIVQNTTGQQCARSSAEWIMERAGSTSLANFGTAAFTGAEARRGSNTHKRSISDLSGFALAMVHNSQLESTSQLSDNGEAFTMNWIRAGKVGE